MFGVIYTVIKYFVYANIMDFSLTVAKDATKNIIRKNLIKTCDEYGYHQIRYKL